MTVIFEIYEDDNGNMTWKLNEEGIDYLIQGLEQLRDVEAGEWLSTTSVTQGDNPGDPPVSVGEHILLRASDEEDETPLPDPRPPRCPHCGKFAPYGDERYIWLRIHTDSKRHALWWKIRDKLRR